MGTVLFPFFCDMSIQYSCLILNKTIFFPPLLPCFKCGLHQVWVEWGSRHWNTSSNLFIVAVHYTYQHMLLLLQNNHNIPYLAAIVDCTHVGSATASFKDLVTFHREYYIRYLGRGSAMACLELGNSWPGARTSQTKQLNKLWGIRCGRNHRHNKYANTSLLCCVMNGT